MLADLLNTHLGRIQQNLGLFQPCLPNIFLDADSCFFFKQSRKVIIRIACPFCQKFNGKILRNMGIDIVAACLYRARAPGGHAASVDPSDVILIHDMVDRSNLTHCAATIDSLHIDITEGIGYIRSQPTAGEAKNIKPNRTAGINPAAFNLIASG